MEVKQTPATPMSSDSSKPSKNQTERFNVTLSQFAQDEINDLADALGIPAVRLCAWLLENEVMGEGFLKMKRRVMKGGSLAEDGSTD